MFLLTHLQHEKYSIYQIIFLWVLNFITLMVCLIVFSNHAALCTLKNQYCHDLCFNIGKKYHFLSLNKPDFKFLSEFSSNLSTNHHDLKYYLYIYSQYDLDNENFLFFTNTMFAGHSFKHIFKNILSFGLGYNIFNGPVYFSQIKFLPSFYHLQSIYEKNCSKMLIGNSWMYSYQLINNIYYSQCLTTLSNFKHVITKLEHGISIGLKPNSVFLKCSYNIIINENKFFTISSNVNKYISLSLLYSL